MNKKVFTVKVDDKELELAVIRPNPKLINEAYLVYNKAWRDAEEKGLVLRRDLDEIAKKRGWWNEDKQREVDLLDQEILSSEKKLRAGGKFLKSKEEGRELALQIRTLRGKRAELVNAKLELDKYTAESYADSRRLDFIVSQITVFNSDGKPYFKNYEDYLERSDQPVAFEAMKNYLEMLVEEFPAQEDQYEVSFLKKFGYADDKGRLINSEGKLITEKNQLITDTGRYVDSDGNYIDLSGTPVDEKGEYLITFEPFEGGV